MNDTHSLPYLRDVLARTLDDPHRAAAVGAATGALKGAAVGLVAGKLLAFTVIGACTGAAVAAVVSGAARGRLTVPAQDGPRRTR